MGYLSWGCLLLVLCVVHSMFLSSSGCFVDERVALMDINSWFMSSKSEVPSSWGHGDDCCLWEGITCDNSTRRILRLDLSFMYQSICTYGSDGSVSIQAMEVPCWNLNLTIFSSFRELQLLDFSGNCACLKDFNGLQGLSKLKYLNLSDNTFIGSIPGSVSRLVSLEVINLSGNNISGTLQNIGLKNLQNLRELHLGSNQLSALKLSNNSLGGMILGGACNLSSVREIYLGNNKFEGTLPRNLSGDVVIMDLHDNKMSGELDTSLWNLPSLKALSLASNGLTGEIPQEIGNLSHIKSLNLSNNFFTGSIPATFANLSQIESLDLSENRLKGSIPWQLTQLSSLGVFSVAFNNLSGCLLDSGQFGSFGMDSYKGNDNLRSCTSSSGPVVRNGTVGNMADDSDPILYVVSAVSFVLAFWATVTFVFCHSFGKRVILNL
ncbi:hypothetical protein ACQ4PT_013722 [Festuca glaucescens]